MSAIGDFTEFFAVEAPRLRGFLRRFGPAISPEDIAQEAFLRFCATDPSAIESPRAFLFSTARHLAIDALRRTKFGAVHSLSLAEERADEQSADAALIAMRRRAGLQAALDSLSDKHRQALVLFKVEGLTHKQIGARLGVSHRTVERYVADALAHCYEMLREPLED